MKLYDGYCEAVKNTNAEGKKMRGAIFAECVKAGIQERLDDFNLNFVVSKNNVFVKGSPYEYDLLILKADCKPEYGVVYDPTDVIACIECKAGGLYNLESETTAIAKAYNRLYALNQDISFGYITLWENKPVNKFKQNGEPTVDQWALTQKYLSEKLVTNKQVVYAVTLKNGKKIIGGLEKEFTDFVSLLVKYNTN